MTKWLRSEGRGSLHPWKDRPRSQPVAQPTVAPTVAPPAAVDPYAWANRYSGVDQYAADVKAQAVAGLAPVNPMPAKGVEAPQSGGTAFIDPFNPDRYMSRKEYGDLESQMRLLHAPTTGQKARQFTQNMLANEIGAPGQAPTSIRTLLGSRTETMDDVIREADHGLSSDVVNRYHASSDAIKRRFSTAMTRYSGKMTFEDILDIGDNISRDYPTHPGFIRDLVESQVSRNPRLAREHEEWLGARTTQDRGNELYQGKTPVEQIQIQKFAQMATSKQAIIHPQMAQELGLVEGSGELEVGEGKKGQWGTRNVAGQFKAVAPEVIAKAYLDMYDISAEQPTAPTAPQAPRIIGTMEVKNAQGESVPGAITYDNGLIVTNEGADIGTGRESKVGTLSAKGTEDGTRDVHELIAELRAKGKDEHMQAAASLERDFGLTATSATPAIPATPGTPAAAEAMDPNATFDIPDDIDRRAWDQILHNLDQTDQRTAKILSPENIEKEQRTVKQQAVFDVVNRLSQQHSVYGGGKTPNEQTLAKSMARKSGVSEAEALAFVQEQVAIATKVEWNNKLRELREDFSKRVMPKARELSDIYKRRESKKKDTSAQGLAKLIRGTSQ